MNDGYWEYNWITGTAGAPFTMDPCLQSHSRFFLTCSKMSPEWNSWRYFIHRIKKTINNKRIHSVKPTQFLWLLIWNEGEYMTIFLKLSTDTLKLYQKVIFNEDPTCILIAESISRNLLDYSIFWNVVWWI